MNACLEESLPNIRVIHCSRKINLMTNRLKRFVRRKTLQWSLPLKAVKEGEARCALLLRKYRGSSTAGLLVVGRIKGIDRQD